MALSGIHVMFGFAGSAGRGASVQSLMRVTSTQNVTAPSTASTAVAPNTDSAQGEPVARICAAADSWVAIGPNPNPAAEPRVFVKGDGYPNDYPCNAGDKVAYVAA